MTKYDSYWKNKETLQDKNKAHPIWAGIGFLLLVIIPFISWAVSYYLIDLNARIRYVTITANMLAQGPDPLLYIRIFLTIAISMALFALMFMIYFLLYRFFGPARYRPYDVPLKGYHVKKYKR